MAKPIEVETASPAAASSPAKSSMLPLLIAAAMSTTLSMAAVAGGSWWLLKSGKIASVVSKSPAQMSSTPVKEAATPPSHLTALEPIVVNLSDAGATSFLRVSISLRIATVPKPKGEKEEAGKGEKADAGFVVGLRDTTLAVLGRQTSDTLLKADGLEVLKKKLREAYVSQNPETHVLNVYVTDFLVQR